MRQQFVRRYVTKRSFHRDFHTQPLRTQHSWATTFQKYFYSFFLNELIFKKHIDNFTQGTIIFSSLHASHNDKNAWHQPDEFIPERYLDEAGKFSPKLDKSIPFGAGKRVCAGETFARNSLFLVATAIIQNFNIAPAKNERIPAPSETVTALIRYAPEFRLRFLPR